MSRSAAVVFSCSGLDGGWEISGADAKGSIGVEKADLLSVAWAKRPERPSGSSQRDEQRTQTGITRRSFQEQPVGNKNHRGCHRPNYQTWNQSQCHRFTRSK